MFRTFIVALLTLTTLSASFAFAADQKSTTNVSDQNLRIVITERIARIEQMKKEIADLQQLIAQANKKIDHDKIVFELSNTVGVASVVTGVLGLCAALEPAIASPGVKVLSASFVVATASFVTAAHENRQITMTQEQKDRLDSTLKALLVRLDGMEQAYDGLLSLN